MPAKTFTDDEAERFREEIRAWLTTAVPQEWREKRDSMEGEELQSVMREWDRTLAADNFAGVSWPPAYGGRGLGPIEELIYYEESAKAHAPEGFGRIGRILAGPTIIHRGSERQQQRYLAPILNGSEIWCQGFSEPGAGSDLAAVRTRAVREDGGYRVSGQKTWTSFAQYADRCLLLAKTDDGGPRHRNLTMFLLDMRQPGVDIRPIKQISGEQEFSEVFFDGAWVADEDRLDEENSGWSVAMTVLENERGTVEAGTRLVEIQSEVDLLTACCVRSSQERVRLEEIREGTDLLRWHVLRTTEERAAGAEWLVAGSTLKLQWSELWQAVTTLGVDVDCPTHRQYWRRIYLEARAATIYSGTSEIQRNVITDRILRLPR